MADCSRVGSFGYARGDRGHRRAVLDLVFARRNHHECHALPSLRRSSLDRPGIHRSGLRKLAGYSATIDLLLSSKLPFPVPLAYMGVVLVEIGCGVLKITGYSY
jgi:hypothetical protein